MSHFKTTQSISSIFSFLLAARPLEFSTEFFNSSAVGFQTFTALAREFKIRTHSSNTVVLILSDISSCNKERTAGIVQPELKRVSGGYLKVYPTQWFPLILCAFTRARARWATPSVDSHVQTDPSSDLPPDGSTCNHGNGPATAEENNAPAQTRACRFRARLTRLSSSGTGRNANGYSIFYSLGGFDPKKI